jgi:uncharacterized protein YuzE
MKVMYDPTTDTLSMILVSSAVAESDEIRPGVILDLDRDGHVVAIEILDASRRVEIPNEVQFQIAAETAG